MDVGNVGELRELLATLARTNTELIDATSAGDLDRATDLIEDLRRLERRRNALVHRLPGTAPSRSYETAIPLRDRLIQALTLGGRPMAAKLLADVCRSYLGEPIQTTALSSLRRDERRRWSTARTDHTHAGADEYVVAALSADRFTPVRGTLALSSWPLEHRLIAPSSPRVDVLHITAALARHLDGAADRPAATRLLLRLARTIPDALPQRRELDLGPGALDTPAIIAAARAELDQLSDRDEFDRTRAAGDAQALSLESRLFGSTAHRLVAISSQEQR